MKRLIESILSSTKTGMEERNKEVLAEIIKILNGFNDFSNIAYDFMKKNNFLPKNNLIDIVDAHEKEYLHKLYKLRTYHTVTWRGKKDTDKPREFTSRGYTCYFEDRKDNTIPAYIHGVHIGYNEFSSGVTYVHGSYYFVGISEEALYIADLPELKAFIKQVDKCFKDKPEIVESKYAKSQPFSTYRKYYWKDINKSLKL